MLTGRLGRLLLLAPLLVAALCAPPAHAGSVTEPSLTIAAGSDPWEIATGPDGALWFTENGNPGRIGRHAPGGGVTEYDVPTKDKHPRGLAVGGDGNLWFTHDDALGRVTPSGAVTEYSAGLSSGGRPWDIAPGPDGRMWFTEASGNRIGRIAANGTITEFPVIVGGTQPHGIALGPDGNVWFTLAGGAGGIARITPVGAVTVFGGLTAGAPEHITAGPDGNLWFTEAAGPGMIGRITPGGTVTEFPLPQANLAPGAIATASDGALWFTYTANPGGIGRITTAGAITLQALPATNSAPRGIATGPDGNLWITETATAKLARAMVAPASETLPATGIGSSGVVLRGRLRPNAQVTQYRFEWGPTTAYGKQTPLRAAGNGTDTIDVAEPLSGLTPGRTYHYRLTTANDAGTVAGTDETFTTATLPVVPAAPGAGAASARPAAPSATSLAPELGRAVVVRPARGTIRVRKPGERRSVRLASAGAEIPVGAVVDARKGAVELTSAIDTAGRTQTGVFSAGAFRVRQARNGRGRTDLVLRGGRFGACRRTARPLAGAAAARHGSRRSVRRLWGRDHSGRFRTFGRDSVAVVRGTRWLTEDRCGGTLTRVVEGAVQVRDRRGGKVLVKAGHSHFARHRR